MLGARLVSTFSIVARDAASGDFGVAVQSRHFNVGAAVPWAEAGTGAVATQAFVEIGYGPRVLDLLRAGAGAKQALDRLLAADPAAAIRQVAVVDAHGDVAVHTGAGCIPFAGHRVGDGFTVQGNLLATDRVCDAMARAFERAPGAFPSRLVAALEAGQTAGGDARGRESAALFVVRSVSASEPWRNRAVDLRVENHRKPIDELQRLLRIHQAFFALGEATRALGEGRIDDARALGAEALRRGRAHDEVSFWVGIILARLGDEDAGVRALRSALRRNARLRSVLLQLPTAYRPPETVLRRVLLRHELRRLRPTTAASI
jgi:uncharacterized Ntn-hydrolase superfamily protein